MYDLTPKSGQKKTQKSKTISTNKRRMTCAPPLSVTLRGGLLLVIKVFKALRLKKLADILFRLPGSNHGYLNGDILTTLVAMQNEGARCLSDVSRLHKESGLLKRVCV